MADEIDIANEQAELFLRNSLQKKLPTLAPKGSCYNCDHVFVAASRNAAGVEVDEAGVPITDLLYCDKDCLDDHADRMRLSKLR